MSNEIDTTGIRWEVKRNVTPRGLLSNLPPSPYRKVIPAFAGTQSELPLPIVSAPSTLRTGREFVTAPASLSLLTIAKVAAFAFVVVFVVIL